MADIERWITINGVHIPIMKGESKMSAVGRFIKGNLRNRQLKRQGEYGFKKGIKFTSEGKEKAKKEAQNYMKEKYGKNWNKLNSHDIKGHAPSRDAQIKIAKEIYKEEAKMAETLNLPTKNNDEENFAKAFRYATGLKEAHDNYAKNIDKTTARYKLKTIKSTKLKNK